MLSSAVGQAFRQAFRQVFRQAFGQAFGQTFGKAFRQAFGEAFRQAFGQASGQAFGQAFRRAFRQVFGKAFGWKAFFGNFSATFRPLFAHFSHVFRDTKRKDFFGYSLCVKCLLLLFVFVQRSPVDVLAPICFECVFLLLV